MRGGGRRCLRPASLNETNQALYTVAMVFLRSPVKPVIAPGPQVISRAVNDNVIWDRAEKFDARLSQQPRRLLVSRFSFSHTVSPYPRCIFYKEKNQQYSYYLQRSLVTKAIIRR
jgi:hypothetical protein